jgi:hypothetical protein
MKPRVFILTSAALLWFSSCASRENVPAITMGTPPDSIRVGRFVPFGPYDTIVGEATGKVTDNPPGVKAEVQTVSPARSNPGTYRIMPPGVLRVMNIENPSRFTQIGKAVSTWQNILDRKNAQLIKSGGQLAELPWMNAAQCFHAKARVLDLPWGKAGVFLTSYVQGRHGGPVNNDELTLVVQGISKDGRHFVSAHFAIRHPGLPDDALDEHHKGRTYFPIDDTDDGRAEAWLDQQADESFAPGLNEVEAMLAGLKIETP